MTFQPGASVYTQGFGSRPENVEVPFIAARAPTSTDVNFPIGKRWIYSGTAEYILLSFSTSVGVLSANWQVAAAAAGTVATLTGDSGTATPSAGNIQIAGTTNQITTTGSGAAVTLSLPSAITAPGSLTTTTTLAATTTVTAGTGLTVTTGDATVTAGNVILNGAAKQLRVHGGAVTDFIGTATLTSGTVTVANTNIAATDRILVTRSAVNASTALGVFKVVKTGSTNFVITACKPADGTTETGDASTVDYFIVRQV